MLASCKVRVIFVVCSSCFPEISRKFFSRVHFSVYMDLLITILELILILIAVGSVALCVLSWLTPWPARTVEELQQTMTVYSPGNAHPEQFTSLFEGSFRKLQVTDPDLYLSVIIPAMNEVVILGSFF